MSLLAGIKFIPRSDRDSKKDVPSHDKSKRSSREWEENNKSSKKKHKHEKSKHKKDHKSRKIIELSKRYDEKNNGSASSSDSDGDDNVDMNAIAEEEALKTQSLSNTKHNRMPWMSNSDSFQPMTSKTSQSLVHEVIAAVEVSKRNEFNDLLSKLSGETKTNKNQPTIDKSNISDDEVDEIRISKYSHSSKGAIATNISDNTTNTNNKSGGNFSIAELLRQKLKSNKGSALKSTDSEVLIYGDPTRTIVSKSKLLQEKNSSIQAMKANEKYNGDDMDENFRRNVLRLGDRYQGSDMTSKGGFGGGNRSGYDEEDDIDMTMFQSRGGDGGDPNLRLESKSDIMKAINKSKKTQDIISKCHLCHESSYFKQYSNYVISTGDYTMLRVKRGGYRLSDLHCEIVPLHHIESIRKCQDKEEVCIEIERYKSCLRRFYEVSGLKVSPGSPGSEGPGSGSEGCSAVFMEAAVGFSSMPHTVIDCVPVKIGDEKNAGMFFSEAISSQGEEWSQHQKVIKLRRERRLHRAVPEHFEYLCIEWGDDQSTSAEGGYEGIAHAIESGGSIDRMFCLDVMAGMMEEDPMKIRSKMKISDLEEKRVIDNFRKLWSPHDWTKYL